MASPSGCSRTLLGAVAVVVLGGVIAGTAAVLLRPRGVVTQIEAARLGTMLVQIQCDGTLEPLLGGELRTADGGVVATIALHDGDRVRTGDLVLRLVNPQLEADASQARAEVLRFEAEETEAKAAVETAREEVAHWEEVVGADRRLLAQGAATSAELEKDRLALAAARERHAAARAQLASFAGSGGQLELARSAVAALGARVAALDVRAANDGVVYGLPRRTGVLVSAGDLLASVTNPDKPRVRLQVDQPDLPQVALGQRLVVTFSGLPERQWTGRVVAVTNALRQAGDRLVGEVVGEIADPAHLLPLNASVDAQIVVAEKHAVLTIPRAALYRDGEHRYVYVLRDGRARRKEITVDLIGLNEVEVTGGLAVGEGVLVAGEVPLAEGLRVRPVA